MLDELTQEQRDRMPAYVAEWIAVGTNTDPANREEAERGLVEAYAAAKLPAPQVIVWQGSPYTGAIAASLLANDKATPDTIDDAVNAYLDRAREGNLTEAEKQDIRERTYWGGAKGAVYAQHDVGWLSFYDFFARETTAELAKIVEPLTGMMRVARNAGWFWPFERAVVITERPVELHLTDEADITQRRMHNLSGPAIRYPDGFKLYFAQGQPVPGHIIEKPQEITVDMVDKERNAEVRRVMIELMGAEKYLENATLLDEDVDELGLPRKLWFRAVKDDAAYVAVELANSTVDHTGVRRKYFQRVPPETKTAIEGAAWLAGKSVDEFRLVVQT